MPPRAETGIQDAVSNEVSRRPGRFSFRRQARKVSMARTTLALAQIDQRLDRLALKPASFEAGAKRLARELDRKNTDLEIRDPQSWRKGTPATQASLVSFVQQFRHDVDDILIMERDEEARHARRVEFARLRLAVACKAAGVESIPDAEAASTLAAAVADPSVRRSLLRRQMELHALRTEMVERNLYLVLINVEHYAHTGASRTDLIQEGCLSLFRAVDGFDWRRGLLFRTYAVHWLNQAFRNHLYNFGNTVRLPVYLQKAMKHVNAARAKLGDQGASVEAIAEHADLSKSIVMAAIGAGRTSASLDASMGNDGEGGRFRDILAAKAPENDGYDPSIEGRTLEADLGAALSRLSDREREVIELRFGLGADRESTLSEVADRMGVSVERIRQIQMRAMSKLNTSRLRRTFEPWLN
jgi:RNA polymerase sigma factor (sigma-70 family)